MSKDIKWINLADIIDRQEARGIGARRVAEFGIDKQGALHIAEACDDYFEITLTAEESARLLAWLTERISAG